MSTKPVVNISTLEDFQRNKQLLHETFKKAIYETLVEMGEDIHGIDWFGSYAEFHPKNQMKARRAA